MKCHAAILGAVGMLSCVVGSLCAQTVTVSDGKWSSPATWNTGVVPNSGDGQIIINHTVTIPADTILALDEVVVNGDLTIAENAIVTIYFSASGVADLRVAGSLHVFGKMICRDLAVAETTQQNTTFYEGSTYEHQYFSIAGEPPQATWHPAATLLITGYTTSKSFSTSGWQQHFGNVVYQCSGQTTFVDMLGNLKHIAGDLRISDTNGNILRLSLDKKTLSVIEVGGDFIVEGNSEVWISREGNTQLNVAGNMELRSVSAAASYLTTQGNGELNVAGNVLLSSVGALRFASAGGGTGIFRIAGNVTMNSGLLTANAPGVGILEFNGNTRQTISLSTDLPAVITIINNNASETEIISNHQLFGSIQCNAGNLILPEHFSLYGNLTVSEQASVQCPETLSVLGVANQQLDLNGETLLNVKINKPSGTTVTLTSAMHLGGYLHIESLNTDLISNGNLTLLSQADDGSSDASVYSLLAGSDVIGDVHVQRYMEGEGRIYRYISMPVLNATVKDLQDDFPITGTFIDPSTGSGINKSAPSFFYYDESLAGEAGWTAYPKTGLAEEAILQCGLGYAAFIRNATTATCWDVTGTINQGDIDLPVYFHAHDDLLNDGWNLVGNPYPATIDWDAADGWEKRNLETAIYIRENGTGQFLFWDGEVGNLGSGRIAKGQSFWVKANADNPELIIHESAKVMNNTAFYRNKNAVIEYLEVTLSSDTHEDKAYLRLQAGATSALEGTDVVKMKNDHVNISFLQEDVSTAIASVRQIDCQQSMPLQLSYAKGQTLPAGFYTLEFQTYGVFSMHPLQLLDAYTNERIELINLEYTFWVTDDSISRGQNRFSLVFKPIHLPDDFSVEPATVFCPEAPLVIGLNHLPEYWRVTLIAGEASIIKHSAASVWQQIEIPVATSEGNAVTWLLELENACAKTQLNGVVPLLSLPEITAKQGTLYTSVLADQYQWKYEGKIIAEATQREYIPLKTGRYSVKVVVDGCEVEGQYDFILQDIQPKLWPNPLTDVVTCTAGYDEKIAAYQLTDVSGGLLENQELKDPAIQLEMNLAHLPSGVYILRLRTDKSWHALRIIKK